MENELDIHQALKVFHKIVKMGEKHGDGHTLLGVTALSDFDGYTIILQDNNASLTIYFHNKYQIESTNKLAEKDFFDKLKKIERLN